ncbi:hypothetical protein FB009_12448 [Sinorhizobium medicae]|uniref:hypothetical protein n=1 Tax=Sinorhizobium medicae TaxID=110321 RepID=UPI00119AEE68|nr:hypothetical protein [Sinorhizobium medicae]MDX1083304.1 hypothetical protein [Sinorhizobium medicae]MQU73945.1 hypothetical protein [Sinorhizobium medicae]TWA32651.1 hypothetical protein FB009_12448 [Sinorhizobium medicae]
MAHLRSQIFAAVIARLAAIPEFSAADKVKRGRKGAIPQEKLPALTVTWADRSEIVTVRPSSGPAGEDGYDRFLPLSIIVHLRDDEPEEEFDRICTLIEASMASDITFGGLVIEALLQTQQYFVNPQTGISLLAGSLNYQIAYKTLAANPELAAL